MRSVMILFVVTLAMVTAVSAQVIPVDIEYVEVNDEKYYEETEIAELIKRGETIEVEVKLFAHEDVENVQIEAYISGYRYNTYESNLISDTTRSFDMDNQTTDKFTLNLEIPIFMELEDVKLRIRVSNANDLSIEQVYQLRVDGLDDGEAIFIRDFTVSPSSTVVAGRPLSFKVLVENLGDDELDDVSVTVSIPELGISDNEYLNELDVDEVETFEELLLRVPTCAEPGVYTAEALVEFDRYESVSSTMTVVVLESDSCDAGSATSTSTSEPVAKTVITVPDSQEVALGTGGAVYPITISNLGTSASTYTLTVSGVETWGTVRLDPAAVVVVQPESVKTVYMYVTANEDAAAGAKVFKLTVDSSADSEEVVLSANVTEGDAAEYDSLRRGLEIGLIVLVIILIILGLIIGFNKLRGDRDDAEDETQTYY